MKKDYSNQLGKKLIIKEKGKISQVNLSDIIYIKSNGHTSIINCLNNKNFCVYKSLKEYEEELKDEDFIRINKQTIINLYYLNSYKSNNGKPLVITNNNTSFRISKTKLHEIIKRII